MILIGGHESSRVTLKILASPILEQPQISMETRARLVPAPQNQYLRVRERLALLSDFRSSPEVRAGLLRHTDLGIGSIHLPQRLADFAYGRVSPHRVHKIRHRVERRNFPI